MQFDNKKLFLILIVLASILGVAKFIKSNDKGTLPTNLIQVDTSQINKIILRPKSESTELTFIRKSIGWIIKKDEITSDIPTTTIKAVLSDLQSFKPQRLISTSPEKHKKYQVNDSLGMKVSIFEKDKKNEIIIGKFSYKQSPNVNPQNQGMSGTGMTYFRLADQNEIYTTEGFMAMTLDKPFNEWRSQTLIRAFRGNIEKLTFEIPDENFVLIKNDSSWQNPDFEINNKKLENYLRQISAKNYTDFADEFKPKTKATHRLKIEGQNLKNTPIIVEAWQESDSIFYLHSSLNSAFFKSKKTAIFSEIFKKKADFQ